MLTDTQPNSNRLTVKVAKELYYSQESMWGIISVEPVKIEGDFEPELNQWNNFVIRGNLPFSVMKGQELDIEVSDAQYDPKYKSNYHEIIRVHVEALNTVDAQQRFLYAIVSEYRANLIVKAYPTSMIIDDIKNNVIDITNIKGIGEHTAGEIKKAIERNKDLGALMVELADLNLTGRMLNKIIEKFGDTTIALYKSKESLYNLCSISGISFKRVDDAAMRRGEDKFGAKRIKAYSEHYFDEIANQGHSWVNERIFLEQAMSDLDVNGKFIRDYMKTDDGKRYFYWQQGDKRISSMRMYDNEKNTLKNLLRLASKYEPPENLNIDKAIKDAEYSLGISYTDEQKEAISESLKHGVFIMNGSAGTGKSTVIRGIVEVLTSIGLTYQAAALSGKASQVLLSRGINSATIHRTFGIGINGADNKPMQDTNTDLDSDDVDLDTTGFDVVIIDESSMVNAQLFSQVLEKIKSGAKLILVGDSGQLSAIGHGDVLRDLLQTGYFKVFELKQIHRQAKDSGIIELASNVRNGEQVCKQSFQGKEAYGSSKDMVLIGYQEKENISLDLEKILRGQAKQIKQQEDIMDYQVVVAMRERGDLSARAINHLAQSIFNDLDKPFVNHNGYDYREGDKVIVKGNSYSIKYYSDLENYYDVKDNFMSEDEVSMHLSSMTTDEEKEKFLDSLPRCKEGDLFNGTMGIIVETYEETEEKPFGEKGKTTKWVLINFEGLGLVAYEQSNLDGIELAYAVTCHRLQGSTIKNVVVVLDYSAYTLLSRQWVYTAITRASKKCVLLAQSSALVKAVATDASGNRQTFLGDMIKTVRSSKGELLTQKV